MDGHPGVRRKRIRPILRWLDDVEADLRSVGFVGWRNAAEDKSVWRQVVNKTKVLQGL